MASLSALLFAFIALAPTALAQNACTASPYGSLLGLSTYAPAESYCSKSYPVAKVKITTTVTATPSDVTTTVVQSVAKREAEPATKTTVTTLQTVTCTGACSTFGSITASQSVPFISTFCSCIETASTTTITKTVTPKPPKTVTKTKTTTITPTATSTPTPTPTNEVNDPGFEQGGISWGFGGCTVASNAPHSGSNEVQCIAAANNQYSASQNLGTALGPSTLSAYIGYIGSSSTSSVPVTTIYINGQNVYQSYICGDGTGVGAGGDCVLDGQPHYKNIQVPYTVTDANTDIYFAWVFTDDNQLTMLLDDVSFTLN